MDSQDDIMMTLKRQREIADAIRSLEVNFKKDSHTRKTEEYLKTRLNSLESLWAEFDKNNTKLMTTPDKSGEYFVANVYRDVKALWEQVRTMITAYSGAISSTSSASQDNPIVELFSEQKANFRAFQRLLNNIEVDNITEKWELEDELRNLQNRWNHIDNLHLKIDNLLGGSDEEYENKYSTFEKQYRLTKRALNQKISSTTHLYQSTPQLEIPTFYGDYTQWPTFQDLYKSGIHDNPILTNAQKMQHLKGKVKGEAQRLIQHLHVSAENYLTAWDLLQHRYNNDHLLFTRQIEIFLNQPAIQKPSSHEIKKLYDTTMESIHAIHNLGIDTTTWDPLLVHLLTKKLDPLTLSEYKQSRKTPRKLPAFEEFVEFLEAKFTALEPVSKRDKEISSALTSKQLTLKPKETYFPAARKPSYNKPFQFNYSNCVLCNNQHALYQCKQFESLSPENKLTTVAKHGLCKNCLYVHERNICNSAKTCKICHKKHNTLLHDAVNKFAAQESRATTSLNQQRQPSIREPSTNHVTNENYEILLTTVQIRVLANDNTYLTLRALLDQGSQTSLITENAAQRLGLPRQQLNASVTGVGENTKKSRGRIQLQCKSIHDNYTFTTNALVMSKLINKLPTRSFGNSNCEHIQHIQLADPDYNISNDVDILLDAKVYADIISSGLIKGPENQPVAQQTKLGWILSGNINMTLNCNVVINNIEDIVNYWEMEEISSSSSSTLTQQEEFCEQLYASTTERLPDGRYKVRLPMKEDFELKLGSSKARAVAQFKQLEDRLTKNSTLHDNYQKFMTEYKDLGHMKECISNHEPMCYLPHHGVHKEDSTTTKLRVVFNASSKTSTGYSLNDLMECGKKLQQDIQDLLIRWRTYRFVYTADCEKMYRCILIHEDHQHLQKIMWRDHPQDLLKEYQLCTVTYGMKAAPFLAMRTMAQLASDDIDKYPLAAEVLKKDFYVDDLLSGSNTIEQAQEIQQQLIDMLQGAGINLRKWASNTPQLLCNLSPEQINQSTIDLKHVTSTKALGLRWSPVTDNFTFNYTDKHPELIKCSKRILLSEISRIFDPLGFLTPVTIRAKLLFQKVWDAGIDWDDEVPQSIQKEWLHLRDDLHNIDTFQIDRWVGDSTQHIELHGCCDASEKAYACVIYLKSRDDNGKVTTRLVASKSKLAPKKEKVTLPRLELSGALLLSRLMTKVIKAFPRDSIDIFGWTDSLVVLGWLQGDPARWKTFVANRTKEILDTMPAHCWRHISSQNNSADCATRGLTTAQLKIHSLWWEGPPCIKNDNTGDILKVDMPEQEIKHQPRTCAMLISSSVIDELLDKHSSLSRVTRIICYVSRFITNTRHRVLTSRRAKCERGTLGIIQAATITTPYLTSNEIDNAYNIIAKVTQSQEFEHDIAYLKDKGHVSSKSPLLALKPYLDDKQVMRVGGRLQHSQLTENAKHPIILPKKSRLTELAINQAHLRTLHGTVPLTLVALRQRFWVLGGTSTIKKHLKQCVKCIRFKQNKASQLMADLPKPRVTPSRPFTHTGVDFTGQVELKANKGRGIKTTRGYIAVFVCFATKAIHLELASDLSTPTFLAAFKRMCARRGTPKHMYSDNGTNFVGASRVLKQEYHEILQVVNKDFLNDISEMGVTWHFNAASWPSAGGLWEAAVKQTKHHLKRVLGEQKLTYEEFTTLLSQIEACLNSRPLYVMTNATEDEYLTPGHFLIGGPLLSPPMTADGITNHNTRWQLTEKMLHGFWKRWSSDYLHHLQLRSKWHLPKKNLEKDDVVLIKEDNMPPAKWAMGRITELHPGSDGYVRVVSLKANGKEIRRPIIKLVPLPIEKSQSNDHAVTLQTNRNEVTEPLTKPKNAKVTDNPDVTMTTDTAQHRTTNQVRRSKRSLMTSILLLLLACVMPSMQQKLDIDLITNDNTLYFDKISDIRIIQEEWKMVIYYNMTTYWESTAAIENYVQLISKACNNASTCVPVIAQFEHELNELRHYNELLVNKHIKRKRRGLVNGVGYIANTLFGVLDDRFAEKYENDITTIQEREDHIFQLYKNQTSILEAHNNILKRNELIMNKQLTSMTNTLHNMTNDINMAQTTSVRALHAFSIVSSMITADVIISNLRRIQDTLVETVTDIYHGRLNVHLLSPEQIQEQLNVISGHLQDDLTIPADNIRDLYGLLHIRARVTSKSLIMEIRLPLLNRDQFELDGIVNIPRKHGNKTLYMTTGTKYVAINVKKDAVIPMTESDVMSCIHHTNEKMLCPLNHPIYTLKVGESICDMQLMISNNNKQFCRTEIRECTDSWIKLHARDTWLFSCCADCEIRMVCPSGVFTKVLTNTGLMRIPQGCVIKGESFVIHTQHDYRSQMTMQQELYVGIPQISAVNDIIRTSLSKNVKIDIENHDKEYLEIGQKIKFMKEQELEKFSNKDNTHYITIYLLLSITFLTTAIIVVCKLKHRCSRLCAGKNDVSLQEAAPPAPVVLTRASPTPTPPSPKRTVSFKDI